VGLLVVAASRSFVHPFVGVSNKNYDRLSHMLSSRSLPRPDSSFPKAERSLAVCSLQSSSLAVFGRSLNTGRALSVSTLC